MVGSSGAVTPGLQTGSEGNFPADMTLTFNRGASDYSLSDVTSFSGLQQNIAYSADTDTEVATAEPATWMTGILGCVLAGGFGRWVRRRPGTCPTG